MLVEPILLFGFNPVAGLLANQPIHCVHLPLTYSVNNQHLYPLAVIISFFVEPDGTPPLLIIHDIVTPIVLLVSFLYAICISFKNCVPPSSVESVFRCDYASL